MVYNKVDLLKVNYRSRPNEIGMAIISRPFENRKIITQAPVKDVDFWKWMRYRQILPYACAKAYVRDKTHSSNHECFQTLLQVRAFSNSEKCEN